MKYILGVKKGMSRIYDGDKAVAVTVLDVADVVVSHVGEGGYELGKDVKKSRNSALKGKYKGLGYVPMHRAWVSGDAPDGSEIGAKIDVESLELEGKDVKISSRSKGKGFQGVVKRWGFAGGPKTHGQSDRLRAPGSIGAGTDPGRVLPGKKMAGRMGGDKITLKGKKVVKVVDNLVMVSGPVAGSKGSLVLIEVE